LTTSEGYVSSFCLPTSGSYVGKVKQLPDFHGKH